MSDIFKPEMSMTSTTSWGVTTYLLKIKGEKDQIFTSKGEAHAYIRGRLEQAKVYKEKFDHNAKLLGI